MPKGVMFLPFLNSGFMCTESQDTNISEFPLKQVDICSRDNRRTVARLKERKKKSGTVSDYDIEKLNIM